MRHFSHGTARAALMELLESRKLLSSVVVNTVVDGLFPPNSGIISLRNAIATANASSGPTDISFDPKVFATPKTIMLNGTGLSISGIWPTSIDGPAAGVTIDGNGQGTVFTISFGKAHISDLTITHGSRGGIISNTALTLTNVIVTGNSGGPGIVNAGMQSLTLTDATVSNNHNDHASGSQLGTGGGIDTFGGIVTLNNVTISGNTYSGSGYGGGGIYAGVATALNLTNVTISGNMAAGEGGGNGGGILNVGSAAALRNVTVSDNSATGAGGGIDNAAGSMSLADVTVFGNTALSGAGINNGGVEVNNGGKIIVASLTVTNSTVLDSINNLSGVSTTIANSIIAGGASGSFNSLGFNFVSATDGSVGWNSDDLTGTGAHPLDPKLAKPGSYGGATQTMPPLVGSPVIDAGNNALAVDANFNPLTTDQRGLPRIYNGTVDIGAVEFQPPTVASFVVNDGAAQRSLVTSLTINFSEPVTLGTGAITLATVGGATQPFQISTTDHQQYVLTFTGDQVENGSLPDGRYMLTVHAADLSDGSGAPMLQDQSESFLRLFGDYDGNGIVNNADYLRFKTTYGKSAGDMGFLAPFDYDGNGTINNADYLQLKKRYLTMI